MWRKFIFACSPGTGPANTRKMNLRPPCKNELTAIFVVLCGVQSLDVHVLIAQLVGAVQAQAQQIEAQAAQNTKQAKQIEQQQETTRAQAAQNMEQAKQNEEQGERIERLEARVEKLAQAA